MHDDISVHVKKALREETIDRGDLAWVTTRGRLLRRRRRATSMVAAVAAVALGAMLVSSVPSWIDDDGNVRIQPAPDASPDPQPRNALVEVASERQRAEIFAFRALAATGLMRPHSKRTYLWTYAEDTTETAAGWKVGFAASRCTRGSCRGLSGDDPKTGNAMTDTFVIVRLSDARWEVVDVQGNMLGEEKDVLIGYGLADRREASHWEVPAVAVGGPDEGFSVTMFPLWVGPYPTEARGSVCEIQPLNPEGAPAGKASKFYQEVPRREFERAGGVHIRGAQAAQDANDASVTCRQYTGRGWRVVGRPELLRDDGKVVGATAKLEWSAGKGFTAPAACTASFVDERGEVVFEGEGRLEALWRPGELRNYPYRKTVSVTTGGRDVDAARVEDFRCETL